MRYTARYFRETMPEWKRKKDPPLSRLFYRPAGYMLAALLANAGVSANGVSYFSAAIGLAACLLMPLPCPVIGALLINLWLVLDCTDGCIARSVKAQPFGEFADGISSYILVSLLGTSLGLEAYFEGGAILEPGSVWILLMGALASTADTLMRLIHQKYKAEAHALAQREGRPLEDDLRDASGRAGRLRAKWEQDLGVGGILPLLIMVGVLAHAVDLVVLYCFLYYGVSCVAATAIYIRRAMRAVETREGCAR